METNIIIDAEEHNPFKNSEIHFFKDNFITQKQYYEWEGNKERLKSLLTYELDINNTMIPNETELKKLERVIELVSWLNFDNICLEITDDPSVFFNIMLIKGFNLHLNIYLHGNPENIDTFWSLYDKDDMNVKNGCGGISIIFDRIKNLFRKNFSLKNNEDDRDQLIPK